MVEYLPVGITFTCGLWATLGTSGYEQMWRNCKDFPQNKYIARPVYKFVASHSNTVIASAASFVVTDLIVHQLAPMAAKCVWKNVFYYSSSCDIYWSPESSLAWVATVALPIMYAKYKKSA